MAEVLWSWAILEASAQGRRKLNAVRTTGKRAIMPEKKPAASGLRSFHWMPMRSKAVKIAAWYFGVSCVWIFFSGWLLHHLVHDPGLAALLENVKGWFFVSVTALLLGWILHHDFRALHLAAERLRVEQDRLRLISDHLRELNRTLDQRVQERTAELCASNEELDAFAYAVSHDLRAPLRAMSGFSRALAEDFGPQLPAAAHEYLNHIQTGSREMGELIDGLLRLSRSTRGTIQRTSVDLSALAAVILEEHQQAEPGHQVICTIEPRLIADGDAHLLEVALRNLLSNSWKYTSRSPQPSIRVHGHTDATSTTISVSDNGAGFDMQHAGKLFQPFQRLHREEEFPGLGIGLATVLRIIRRHGGTIAGTGTPGAGASFTITLPN